LLQRGGANDAFAYTGGTFMECIGVCIITLWHGATNIITTLAHTLLSSASMVTITG
jgi:thiamine pyrophosphate-dependent acetolactate synthase large subunit-like protein